MIEPLVKVRIFELSTGTSTRLEIEVADGKFVGATIEKFGNRDTRIWLQPAEVEVLRDLLVQEVPR